MVALNMAGVLIQGGIIRRVIGIPGNFSSPYFIHLYPADKKADKWCNFDR